MTELVKQIPAMLTGKELEDALWVRPEYDSSIRKAGAAERLLALDNIYKLYIPSNLSVEVYNKIYLSIIRGLKDKDSISAVRQRNQNFRMIKRQEHQGVISGTDSFTVIGASGIGKSSAIARAITVAAGDKVMTMPETGCQIVPCLQIQCPFDPNLPKLLYIGRELMTKNPYKISIFFMFLFTNICIDDTIKPYNYTYVRRKQHGIFSLS